MKRMCNPCEETPGNGRETETDWSGWFAAPGDIDDFIFYGEPQKRDSER